MLPTRISGPAESPISVAEAKENTRIDFSDEDALVLRKIKSAVDDLDGYNGALGRCICDQIWRMPFSGFSNVMRMPMFNVSNVVLKYLDGSGVEQAVPATSYRVIQSHTGASLHFHNYTAPETQEGHPQPVWAEVTSGYGGADDVPYNVKEAIFRLVDHWYDNRSDAGKSGTMPMGFADIIAKIKRVPV